MLSQLTSLLGLAPKTLGSETKLPDADGEDFADVFAEISDAGGEAIQSETKDAQTAPDTAPDGNHADDEQAVDTDDGLSAEDLDQSDEDAFYHDSDLSEPPIAPPAMGLVSDQPVYPASLQGERASNSATASGVSARRELPGSAQALPQNPNRPGATAAGTAEQGSGTANKGTQPRPLTGQISIQGTGQPDRLPSGEGLVPGSRMPVSAQVLAKGAAPELAASAQVRLLGNEAAEMNISQRTAQNPAAGRGQGADVSSDKTGIVPEVSNTRISQGAATPVPHSPASVDAAKAVGILTNVVADGAPPALRDQNARPANLPPIFQRFQGIGLSGSTGLGMSGTARSEENLAKPTSASIAEGRAPTVSRTEASIALRSGLQQQGPSAVAAPPVHTVGDAEPDPDPDAPLRAAQTGQSISQGPTGAANALPIFSAGRLSTQADINGAGLLSASSRQTTQTAQADIAARAVHTNSATALAEVTAQSQPISDLQENSRNVAAPLAGANGPAQPLIVSSPSVATLRPPLQAEGFERAETPVSPTAEITLPKGVVDQSGLRLPFTPMTIAEGTTPPKAAIPQAATAMAHVDPSDQLIEGDLESPMFDDDLQPIGQAAISRSSALGDANGISGQMAGHSPMGAPTVSGTNFPAFVSRRRAVAEARGDAARTIEAPQSVAVNSQPTPALATPSVPISAAPALLGLGQQMQRAAMAGTVPADMAEEELVEELALHSAGRASSAQTQTVSVSPMPQANRYEAAAVVRQITEGFARVNEGTVELRLNPEELGRVRMFLVSGEHGLTVNILADRPETLDLMRRNVDELARNLAEAGYEGTGFSFGEDRQSGSDAQSSADPGEAAADPSTERQPTPGRTPGQVEGLDIRI